MESVSKLGGVGSVRCLSNRFSMVSKHVWIVATTVCNAQPPASQCERLSIGCPQTYRLRASHVGRLLGLSDTGHVGNQGLLETGNAYYSREANPAQHCTTDASGELHCTGLAKTVASREPSYQPNYHVSMIYRCQVCAISRKLSEFYNIATANFLRLVYNLTVRRVIVHKGLDKKKGIRSV